MGKLLAAQIHEDPDLNNYKVRAIVRSPEEALAVQCDLGGMRLRDGKRQPIPCGDWLETIVADTESDLKEAFKGATKAVLCDASHNEIIWNEQGGGGGGFSIRVPAQESKDLSARLLKEIEAAASCSSTLKHVILRSSMGLASPSTSAAVEAMGGQEALDGARQAEKALVKSGLDHTIVRLGALTDDAGMVPLIFGTNDSILLKRLEEEGSRPPILARADAARLSTFLLKEPQFGMTLDCAWSPKFGRNSVGTEEAVLAAYRQDLKKEIMDRVAVAQ